jgi:hypothetical protein
MTPEKRSMSHLIVRKSKRSRVKTSTKSLLIRWTRRLKMMTDITSLNQPLITMLSTRKSRRMKRNKSLRRKNTNKSTLNIRKQLSIIRNTPLTKNILNIQLLIKSTLPKR